MFCPNCGKELKEGSKFCSGCGAPQEVPVASVQPEAPVVPPVVEPAPVPVQPVEPQYVPPVQPEEPKYVPPVQPEEPVESVSTYYDPIPEEPKKKKKGKKGLVIGIIAAIVVIAAVVAGFFLLRGKGGNKGGTFESAVAKTEAALAGRSDVLSFGNALSNAKNLGASVIVEDIGALVESVTGDSSMAGFINGSAVVDIAATEKGDVSIAGSVDVMGITGTAGIYKSGDDFDAAIKVPAIFGDDAIGISLTNLAKDLEKSVFAPGGDSYLSLDEETFEEVQEALGSALESANISEEDAKELQEKLANSDKTKIEFEKSKEDVNLGNGKVSVEAYKASIDSKKIAAIAETIFDFALDKVDLSSLEEMGADLDMDEISDMIDEIADLGIEINLEYDICKGYLVRLAFEVVDQDITGEIVFGEDPSKTDAIVGKFDMMGADLTITLNVADAADDYFVCEVESDELDVYVKFEFEYYDSDKTFAAVVSNAYTNIMITGDMELSKEAITVGDIEISEDGDTIANIKGVSLTLTTNPTVKKLKDDFKDGYTNVLTMSEEDIFNLVSTLESFM